jgi:hypothetical protein
LALQVLRFNTPCYIHFLAKIYIFSFKELRPAQRAGRIKQGFTNSQLLHDEKVLKKTYRFDRVGFRGMAGFDLGNFDFQGLLMIELKSNSQQQLGTRVR